MELSNNKIKNICNIKIEQITNNHWTINNIRTTNNTGRGSQIKKDIVVEINNNGCWNCISHFKDRQGYVLIWKTDKKYRLHRLILSKKLGRKLNDEEIVRHMCDNPQCCNPNHLLIGSPLDNYNDMVERERRVVAKGEDKSDNLTEKQVSEIYILALSGDSSQKEISKVYGLKRGIVESIVNNKAWVHVTKDINVEDCRLNTIINICEILMSNKKSFRKISRESGVNRETIRKIYSKQIYKDVTSNYIFAERK